MAQKPVFSLFLCFVTFQSVASMQHLNKEGEISFGNFYESAEGKFFSKLGSLLSNQTTGSIEECWFKCLERKDCLSVNTIALDQSRYRCELLNWAGTGFEKHLVTKANSKFMQMQTVCSSNPCQNGGQCTVKDGGTNYTCTCTNHIGRNCELQKCVLFDFEDGPGLHGWTLTGTAFNNQPTYGDNPLERNHGTSNLKGDWYIGTYENRPSPSHPYGIQGNSPTGTATSPPFVIRGRKIRFLMAGGAIGISGRVDLLINGNFVAREINKSNAGAMTQREFDVSALRGQVAQVRIVDNSSGGWGMIIVDHIEDSYCTD